MHIGTFQWKRGRVVWVAGCLLLLGCRPTPLTPTAIAEEGETATISAELPPTEEGSIATVPITATAEPTVMLTTVPLTAIPASATPIPTDEPTPTELPSPTATTVPTPTLPPTATPIPQPDWLIYLNQLRAMAEVPPVVEDQALSLAAKAHAVYMVRADEPSAHSQDSSSPYYSAEGAAAAPSADIFATTQLDGNYDWAMGFWMSGPFHVLQMIDPLQVSVGFGQHQEATGHIQMAAVLDTARGDKLPDSSAEFPRYFPPDGGQTWIVRKSLYEWPEPFGGCAGYGFQPPSGPPVIVQLGTGDITPRVTSYRLLRGDTVVESCLLTETTYVHPNIYTQKFGRSLLDARDAVILLPLHPLEGNQIYTAKLTINGVDHEWSFSVVDRPPLK